MTWPGRGESDDERFLRSHGDAIWRAIVRVLGPTSQDAADCFQQAFVEWCRHRRAASIARPEALFKRIAVARAIDAIRRRVRERGRSTGVDVDATTADDGSPDAAAETNELLADLRGALAELPEPQATAFVLTQIEGDAYDVVATAMGVTANHVGVLVHRARATLRGRLDSHRPMRQGRHP